MTNDKVHTFTTGQVCGMTWLTQQTLYTYTKDFASYFSPTATQHKKGRRFTTHDLEIIQTIRTLKHSRLGIEKIRQALATGYRDVLSPATDREEYSRLAETLYNELDEVKQACQTILKKQEEYHILEVHLGMIEKRLTYTEGYLEALTKYADKIKNTNRMTSLLHRDFEYKT